VANDPIHQFQIENLAPLNVGGLDAALSNASLHMIGGVAAVTLFFAWAMRAGALVPNRAQGLAEMAYGFVHDMVKSTGGEELVKKFFPFVFALFLFIFVANMIGMFPYAFTTTGQIVVAACLALLVFATVLVVGFAKNGLNFLKLFFPAGIPWPLYFIVTPIEIVSFFARPLSHSVRLWANIFAGHVLLKVFAGFVPAMAEAGPLGVAGSVLPLIMTVALYALEFLVAFLQAYVFALLTCIYLNDALHPGHH
jgi:F-type H+-transporting ATPase subunit a